MAKKPRKNIDAPKRRLDMRMDAALFEKLVEIAEAQDRPLSAVVRRAVINEYCGGRQANAAA